MNTYYEVEVQMSGTHEATKHFVEQIAINLGADASAIDEIETYSAKIYIKSEIKPSEMKQRVHAILAMYHMTLHYIDVVYRFEYEMTPDRFCIWADGHEQEYRGKVIFTEENA